MTRTYILTQLLRLGPLTLREIVTITGWPSSAAGWALRNTLDSNAVQELRYRSGVRYVATAGRLDGQVEQVEQGIAGQTAEPRGTIRISAPLSFAVAHLGCLLPLFLQRYREVTVEVDLSDRPVDLLGEGYDLALRIGVLEDSTLIARRIASIERVYCASPAYLAERGTPLNPEDLHGHDCLPYGHGRSVQWRFNAGQGKPLLVNVTGRMRVNNGELLRDAAVQGMGITYLPTFIVGAALKDKAIWLKFRVELG
jgi:DNA-binding transcriptional LysR family regulator